MILGYFQGMWLFPYTIINQAVIEVTINSQERVLTQKFKNKNDSYDNIISEFKPSWRRTNLFLSVGRSLYMNEKACIRSAPDGRYEATSERLRAMTSSQAYDDGQES